LEEGGEEEEVREREKVEEKGQGQEEQVLRTAI